MKIGWIGLGNMGAPMARNLSAAGFDVTGFDLAEQARNDAGIPVASSARMAADGAEALVAMLPKGEHVRAALIESGAIDAAVPGALVVDSSTIAVSDARSLAVDVERTGRHFIDAPVSGGTTGAQKGTLTFMTGGDAEAIEAARPLFDVMGARTFHAGAVGAGQSAKLLNNLMLAINMQSTCEAAILADRLGVDPRALVEIAGVSTGDSWPLRNYYPVPGVVPSAPASRGFHGGFAVSLMRKDLGLALEAAAASDTEIPVAAGIAGRLDRLIDAGQGGLDFSALIRLIDGSTVTDTGAAAVSDAVGMHA